MSHKRIRSIFSPQKESSPSQPRSVIYIDEHGAREICKELDQLATAPEKVVKKEESTACKRPERSTSLSPETIMSEYANRCLVNQVLNLKNECEELEATIKELARTRYLFVNELETVPEVDMYFRMRCRYREARERVSAVLSEIAKMETVISRQEAMDDHEANCLFSSSQL